MAQILVIGWITTDLEMKYSERRVPYVRFGLAERTGFGNQLRTQYYQVWAWNETAQELVSSGLRKGSPVRLSGTLVLEEYTRQDGITRDKRLKVLLSKGGFIPVCRGGNSAAHSKSTVEAIDGDKEPLPE